MANRNIWHTMTIEQICAKLETNADKGLAKKQALARRKKLNNRQPEALQPLFIPTKQSFLRSLVRMLMDPIVLLTLFVALITFFFGDHVLLGGVIVAVLLINVVFCAIANTRVRKVWQKLQFYSNPMVKVIRSGKLYTTDSRNVLPGDLLILSTGDICPADIRLNRGSRVRVTQYVLKADEEQQMQRVSVRKNGDVIYSPEQDVYSPDCENIIYAGSVIEAGFARGIVIETGAHTYIGASNGTVPGTERFTEPDSIAFIRRYSVRFATVQAAILVPLTILLTLTMRQSMTFAECFLTALALCCTAIAEHVVALAGIVRASGIDAAASEKQDESVAIVKNSEASDRLCDFTDLLLLDSAALSDGKYHLESLYACGSIYNTGELVNADVQQLIKDLYLYRTVARPPETLGRDAFDAGLGAPIDALIRHVGIDTAAIDLIRRSSHLSIRDEICTVHNSLNSGEYDVLLSSSDALLQHCTHVMTSDSPKEMDEREQDAISTLCRIYRESGYRILLVANRKDKCISLIGVLAFAQRPGHQFAQCCEHLMSSGVRISIFMPDSAESMKILTDCGFVRNENNDVLTSGAARDQGLDLHVAYGSYRAYLGFTQAQIAEMMDKLKQRGNRVATYCVDNRMQALHDMADLKITCDAIEYRSAKVAESYYDKLPVDGKPFSSRASQNMRRTSDVILRRAGEQGGGLHGIITGRKYAFAVNHNLANAMTYLITVQMFRAVLLLIPAIFGTLTLSAVSLLISGLLLDAAAIGLFSLATLGRAAISSSYPIMRRLEKPITYNAANIISACFSALLLWLGFAILQIFGFVDPVQSTGLGFLSTCLLQGLVFAVTLREYTSNNKKKFKSSLTITSVTFTVLLAACVLIPGLNTLTGCDTLTPPVALLTLVAPLIYFVTYRILSARGLNLHK